MCYLPPVVKIRPFQLTMMIAMRYLYTTIVAILLLLLLSSSNTHGNYLDTLHGGSVHFHEPIQAHRISGVDANPRKGYNGTILVVGDSISRQLWHTVRTCGVRDQAIKEGILYNQTIITRLPEDSGQLYESVYSETWEQLTLMFDRMIPDPSSIQRPFDFVFLDFAALHILHLKPYRLFPHLTTSIYFERLMEKELDSYLQVATVVFVQSPPKICESQYNGPYKTVVDNLDPFLEACTKHFLEIYKTELKKTAKPWMVEESANHTIPTRIFNFTDHETTYQFCKNHTLTGYGSSFYRDRMKEGVNAYLRARPYFRGRVQFYDWYEQTTRVDCWCADGRHYNATFLLDYIAPDLCSKLESLLATLPLVPWTKPPTERTAVTASSSTASDLTQAQFLEQMKARKSAKLVRAQAIARPHGQFLGTVVFFPLCIKLVFVKL